MSFKKHQRGKAGRRALTGVELANIVAAVVIASSLLALTIANMTLMLNRETSKVVTSSLTQVTTVMIVTGHTIAHGDPLSQKVIAIRFYVKLAAGGSPVDFNQSKLTITYYNSRIHVADAYGIGGKCFWSNLSQAEAYFKNGGKAWCIVAVVKGDRDMLLEEGEIFMILLNLRAMGGEALLNPYDTFTVEITPYLGVPLTITKRIPPAIDKLMDLG